MFVNKFKIGIPLISTGSTDINFHIPFNMENQLVDQTNLIDQVYVNNEITKAINPIVDYEKARFNPININNKIMKNVIYNVTFIAGNRYGNIGFTNDDIKYKKNSFKLTFLNLSFYDSPNALEQRLISNVTLYPKLEATDLEPISAVFPLIPGQPKPANDIVIKFILSKNEGYYLYHYKDEVEPPKILYMKATFNNAKTGKSTNLMIENTAYTIDQLVNRLYTKYILTKTIDGYYYRIDETYTSPTNVSYLGNDVIINLYQIQAL